MQLMITNKTFIPQLIWISSPDTLTEEVVLLKSRETRCVKGNSSLRDVTVWDRSVDYRLGQLDKKRMSRHFSIKTIG